MQGASPALAGSSVLVLDGGIWGPWLPGVTELDAESGWPLLYMPA